jgi:hypothetical protein
MDEGKIQHRTFNVQHPTSKAEDALRHASGLRGWMFEVERWMFSAAGSVADLEVRTARRASEIQLSPSVFHLCQSVAQIPHLRELKKAR